MSDPLVTEVRVACSREHAFTTWTADATRWWPRDHSVTSHPDLEVVFESGVGGRIFERGPDGREYDWGEVIRWEPPATLAYHWHIGSARAESTEVEITFLADGEDTVVRIEHRGWERLGADADARRSANRKGWGAVLPLYAEACTA